MLHIPDNKGTTIAGADADTRCPQRAELGCDRVQKRGIFCLQKRELMFPLRRNESYENAMPCKMSTWSYAALRDLLEPCCGPLRGGPGAVNLATDHLLGQTFKECGITALEQLHNLAGSHLRATKISCLFDLLPKKRRCPVCRATSAVLWPMLSRIIQWRGSRSWLQRQSRWTKTNKSSCTGRCCRTSTRVL